MNNRTKKHSRRIAHQRQQREKLLRTVQEAHESIRRGHEKDSDENMQREMERRGYVPKKGGGWRPIAHSIQQDRTPTKPQSKAVKQT